MFAPMKDAAATFLALGLAIIPLATSAQTTDESKSDNLQTAQIKAFTATADRFLAKLKKVYSDIGLNFTGPDKFMPNGAQCSADDSWAFYTMVGPTIRIDSSDYTFIFRTTDNRLTAYSCSSSYQLYKGRPFDMRRGASDWSKDRVIQIATALRDVFVDPKAALLGKPSVENVTNLDDPEKWKITWPRLDSKGHAFEGDSIFIGMDQELGFGQIQIHVTTPYTEQTGKLIEQVVAISKAEAAVRSGTFPEAIYDRKAELKVVLPPKSIRSDWWSPSTGQARLAWVLLFKPVDPAPGGPSDADDVFEVLVDASTGAILGPRMGR
jgi:hypothetical protein